MSFPRSPPHIGCRRNHTSAGWHRWLFLPFQLSLLDSSSLWEQGQLLTEVFFIKLDFGHGQHSYAFPKVPGSENQFHGRPNQFFCQIRGAGRILLLTTDGSGVDPRISTLTPWHFISYFPTGRPRYPEKGGQTDANTPY